MSLAIFFHVAATLALFLVLNSMTERCGGAPWWRRFFALHPLHVESGGVDRGRKDVLSGAVFHPDLGAYTGIGRNSSVSRYPAGAGAVCSGADVQARRGDLPFVLLLLDYWPLRRFTSPSIADAGSSIQFPPPFQPEPALRLVFGKAFHSSCLAMV